MITPEPWPEVRDLFESARVSEGESDNLASFFTEGIVFVSWYLACRDKAALSKVEYLGQGLPTVFNLSQEIAFPEQKFYSMTIDVVESFLRGRVSLEILEKFGKAAREAVASVRPLIPEIIEEYQVGKDTSGAPISFTDVFYPMQIHEFVSLHINEHGFVILGEDELKLLNAMVNDEASLLARISGPQNGVFRR